jgi:selenocysteine lyase/cysteine desulfurase
MFTETSRLNDFSSLRSQVYLDTGAEGIPPHSVFDAVQRYCADKAIGVKGRVQHFAELDRCREITAQFLKLSPEEVAFCSCSAEAYNLLATALHPTADDEIVLNELDYPSGTTPWLAPNCAAKTRMWKARTGKLAVEDLKPLLSSRTKLVQTSLVSFYSGFLLDWKPFVALVRQSCPQAILAVDVTQALGRCVIDCSDADFIVSSTHKWVLGIHGTGIIGVPRRRASELTAHAGGWFNLDNAFTPNRFDGPAIKTGAASYACGMPSFAPIYALNTALRYLAGIGVSAIAEHADRLVQQLCAGLVEIGLQPMAGSNNRSGIVCFRHEKGAAIAERLAQQSIMVNFNIDRVRISVHGYNTRKDIEQILVALGRILKTL